MIKNIEKDLRIYRHDTFITSFFATLTILLIVLIICSVPTHAQTISGTNTNGETYTYDDDSSNLTNVVNEFNVDTNQTNPTGILNTGDSNISVLVGNNKNANNYYRYSTNDNTGLGLISTNFPKTFTINGNSYNITDYSNFVIFTSALAGGTDINFEITFSNMDFTYFMGGRYLNTIDLCTLDSSAITIVRNQNGSFAFKTAVSRTYDYSSLNDGSRNAYYVGDGYSSIIYANCSVTGPSYSLNSAGTGRQYSSYDGFEYNYLNGQVGNGGSSSGGESPDNNLVMNNGDWTFKNDRYTAPYDENFPTGSIYPNGSVSFSFNPTTYQSSNPSAFEIVFTFYFMYDVNYKNLHQAFSVFETTSSFLNNTKRYSHTYNYNDDGAVEIVVPLSEFISNGNSKSWTWQDIFDKLENGALSSVLSNSREVTSISYNKFDLTATAYIKSSNDKSGSITEWYNPMNKKGYTTDDSGSLNKNPYVPSASEDPDSSNSQNPEGNAPGEGGNNGNGGSTTTSNGGNVTVYNYNTNNNNNSLSNDGNTFNDIFTSMIGNNKVTSESLADTTGTNGFLSFMNNTLSGVPTLFFTNLLNFFITCLAILIVAFVLRMLLDIL